MSTRTSNRVKTPTVRYIPEYTPARSRRTAHTARTTRTARTARTAKSGKKTIKSSKKFGFFPKRSWFVPKFNPNTTTTRRLEKSIGVNLLESIMQKEKLTARKFYKQSSNRLQCIKSIGDISYGHTTCWICGLVIKNNQAETGTHPAECEHILPINDAVVFLSLYSQSTADDPLTKIEYAWAHTRCNQEKSNMSPLYSENVKRGNRVIQVFKINTEPIKQVVGDIFDNKLKYKESAQPIHNDLLRAYKTRENFIEKRTKGMMEKYQIIIDTISRGDKYGKASFVTLAGAASSINPSSLSSKVIPHIYRSLKGFKIQTKATTASARVSARKTKEDKAAEQLLSFWQAPTVPEGDENTNENDTARMKD